MAYKDTKIIRYAARLACIHDYIFLDDMTRGIESLSRDKCIESIKTLGAYVLKNGNNIDDPANMLWKQASREAEGIGNKDIEAVERWDLVGPAPSLAQSWGLTEPINSGRAIDPRKVP